jgi:hypothetical protein
MCGNCGLKSDVPTARQRSLEGKTGRTDVRYVVPVFILKDLSGEVEWRWRNNVTNQKAEYSPGTVHNTSFINPMTVRPGRHDLSSYTTAKSSLILTRKPSTEHRATPCNTNSLCDRGKET